VLTYNYMVVDSPTAPVDRLFHALADATRRDILRRSLRGEFSVSALASNFDMSFAAVQKHVAVLEKAELVTKRAHGREQRVRANVATLHAATELLQEFEVLWRERLDRFDEVLKEEKGKKL